MSEAATPIARETEANETGAPARSGGEIRLSFGYFYVLLRWGKERRSNDRIDSERKHYPVLTASNVPVLIAAWTAVFLLSYFALKVALGALVLAIG